MPIPTWLSEIPRKGSDAVKMYNDNADVKKKKKRKKKKGENIEEPEDESAVLRTFEQVSFSKRVKLAL
jgi:hypothetical protein